MLLRNMDSLLQDPRAVIIVFLLAVPGRLFAISAHEFGHAWMANRCGDPTARMLGRLTMDPRKHLDPIGTIMMLVVGFGWAKPVPVNPRNYRNGRRDDLKVSLAGVCVNLLLFLIGFLLSAVMVYIAIRPYGPLLQELIAHSASLTPEFIETTLGRMASYIYQMLVYFVYANICLAIFNLLPVPPLDGFHVVCDLFPAYGRKLATRRAQQITMIVLLALMFTDVLGRALSYAMQAALSGTGWLTMRLFDLIGLI